MPISLSRSIYLYILILIIPFVTYSQTSTNKASKIKFATTPVPTSNPTVCATTGDDGTTNITGSINTYFPPPGNVSLASGTNSIVLSAVPAVDPYGNSFGTVPIKPGDLLLIIQMQDATINFSNSTLYGANSATSGADGLGGAGFTDLGNSGKFEYVIATSSVPLTGGTLTFKGSGASNGTVYSYVNADPTAAQGKRSFQIIRLPQYSNLKLSSDISPPPFNGSAGGIIAFNVGGNMDFNGHTIDVSGRGFRGGYSLIKVTQGVNLSDLYVANSDDNRVSGKGEGTAGTPRYMWDGYNQVDNIVEGLPGGSGGRGAPANAAGGGNDVNAGGGGGGNGGSGGVGGYGYQVDPGTFPNGGRPGSVNYTGSVDVTRLIMGGGGGGGHANDALTGVKGGVGGGVVIITAQSVTGNGTILANGGDGAPGTYGGHPDGSGGGGAGGTVFLKLSNPDPTATLTIHAIGGKGGNTENDDPATDGVQPHGPGGGGGGGQILYAVLTGTVNVDVSPGASGKTNSGNGITHNAANGYPGVTNKFTIASLPPYLQGSSGTCYPILVTTMKVTNPGHVNASGDNVNYIITITNNASGGNAGGVEAYASFLSGIAFTSATATYTGAASGPTTLSNLGTTNTPVLGDFNIPAGETVTITLVANITCLPSGTYNSSAEAVYYDPTRLSTDPNRRITAATNAFTGSNTTYQAGPAGPVPGSNYNGASSTAEDVIVAGNNIANNIITAPAITSFCTSGDPAVITGSIPTGGNGTYTYQWQSSTDNVTFTNIAGATVKDYDSPVINVTTYFRRTVTSGSCTAPLNSNVVTLTVSNVATNNQITAPAVTTFCNSGDPAAITGSTPTGGSGTFSYQWQSSTDGVTFTNITGATAKDYDSPVINATTYFQRVVTSGACLTPIVSNVVKITITISPAVSNNVITPPAIIGFCASGDPATITGSTPTGGNGTFSYQWQSSADNTTFIDITGATAKDYQTSIINTTTYYRREVTSGSCNTPSISNVVQIIILPVVANNSITAPSVTNFCTSGDPGIITGSTPAGGSGTFNYQWQSSVDGVTFVNITGAIAKDYDPSAISATTYYQRLVTSGSCATPLISNVVKITVTAAASPLANNVISAPATTSFCSTSDPAVITGSTPAGGTGSYNYQWQSSTDNINFADITAATAKDYDPTAISVTTYYRRNVTSGSCATPVLSNIITITIQPALANNSITPPAVTSFCTSGNPSVITGSTPTGGNGTYSYQWQNSADNATFADINGATAKDYDPPVITVTIYYRRMVSSSVCNVPLASNTVEFIINASPATPVPVTSPVLVCAGNSATLAVASPQQGLTYNWYDSPAKTNHLFTGITYVTNPVNVNTAFYVEAVSSTCSSLLLATVQVNVTSAPATPLVVNNSVATCNGSMATLSISNPQNGLTYNWYTSATAGSPVYTGGDFVTPAITANITYYAEAANNGGCSSPTRAAVNVTMNALPQLTVQGAAVCPGSNAVLTASSDAANATINWYASAIDGNIIHTGTSYTTPAVTASTNYYVEAVNNATGCVSQARSLVQATLLEQLTAPVVSVGSTTISSITFQWDAVDGATGYQVSIDNGQTFADPSSGSNGLTNTITGLQPNQSVTIIVKAIGAQSCQLSTSSTAVTAEAVSALGDRIYVANAFTPNGDTHNDVVYVHSDNIKSLKFYVYDQWGELIFTSLSQQNGWDGTYKGAREPVGVYVYYLEAIMYSGDKVNKKGSITLLR